MGDGPEIKVLYTGGYKAQLQELHAQRSWGHHGSSWWIRIKQVVELTKAASILDYGCGRGSLKQAASSLVEVREYDPGIPGKDGVPYPADLVVCTDVLEHIEPACLTSVLDHLGALALKGMFLVIACNQSKHTLPDGRNAHLIVETPVWWTNMLRAQFPTFRASFDKTHPVKGRVVATLLR